MDVLRKALVPGLASVALALAGCGLGGETDKDRTAIRTVINQFALAHDARACDLLTDDALRNVYGGFTASRAQSRRTCRARSQRFKGSPVKVTQINFTDSADAKAGALSADGKVAYTVALRKTGGRWRINQITQGKPKA